MQVNHLKIDEVRSFIDKGEGILVDTLPPEHFEARHIPGAVNACVYEVVFLDTLNGVVVGRDSKVVLYGAGPASKDCFAAADKLLRAGYSDVSVFPGGLEEWRESGHALEGSAAEEIEPPHPVLTLEPRVYHVDTVQSVIGWTGRNNNGGHTGTLRLKSGELQCSGEMRGSFTIDMTSITDLDLEGNELKPVLEEHLNSDDFFFTSVFPEAEFTTTEVRLIKGGQATRPNAFIRGNLSLRGITREIAFPAHIRNIDDGQVAVLANLDFDRTDWGVIYGSSRFFQYLSYHLVYDFISVDFRLVLK